jgi:hypothetical protein
MNRKTAPALFLLAITAVFGAACEVSYSSASISDVTLAKSVTADKEPVEPTNTFAPQVPTIHCVVKLANAPEGTKVKAKWSVVNVPGEQANQQIVESEVDNAGGGKNVIDFTLTLPAGEYKVEVYLNPKADKAEPPTKTLTFTVK